MKAAVETAHEVGNRDPSVLKIFVAPEFYFRGPNGAYDAATIINREESEETPGSTDDDDDFNTISEICEALDAIVSDEKYENWLFVFGTIIAASVDGATSPNDYLFFNFAPIYQGGKGGIRMLAPKE
jgi:hypothetical protein